MLAALPMALGFFGVAATANADRTIEPQGRKPRHAPVRPGKAKALWGFEGLHCAAKSKRALRAEGDMA